MRLFNRKKEDQFIPDEKLAELNTIKKALLEEK